MQRLEGQLAERSAEAQRAQQLLASMADRLERELQAAQQDAQYAKREALHAKQQLEEAAAEAAALRAGAAQQQVGRQRGEREGGGWEARLQEAQAQHQELMQHLQEQQQEVGC